MSFNKIKEEFHLNKNFASYLVFTAVVSISCVLAIKHFGAPPFLSLIPVGLITVGIVG